jgi:MATE family multidrug resistance protein
MDAARIRSELVQLGRLAAPLVVSQLSQVGMGFTDTVMAGRISAADLGAIAIGTTLWLPAYLGCLGVLMAIAPLVAGSYGAGRFDRIREWFGQGLWTAFALAVGSVALTRALPSAMPWIGIDPAIAPTIDGYVKAVAWGMPGACAYLAMRFVSEGVGNTRPMMYIQLGALVVNAIGNYVFMFGALGVPAMGAVGAGWSTALVLWMDALAMLAVIVYDRRLRAFRPPAPPYLPDLVRQLRLIRLGVPIALTTLMEVGMFAAVTLLMGSLGTVAVAGHQVALNYAALVFMVPLGLSLATTIRVGHARGRGDFGAARLAGLTGIGTTTAFMCLSALVMLAVPRHIVAIYTHDPAVSAMAVSLLYIAAAFQIFDGLQVAVIGALRGLKDTSWPMLINFVSYWLIGLPLAYLLGIGRAFGPKGLWLGLTAGLLTASALLLLRFNLLTRAHAAKPKAASCAPPAGGEPG